MMGTVVYGMNMFEVVLTETFESWFAGLADEAAKSRILDRLSRARDGNLGDHKSVGGGVSEIRLTYGPGYRIYFLRRGTTIVIALSGGDKSTQKKDVKLAREMAKEI